MTLERIDWVKKFGRSMSKRYSLSREKIAVKSSWSLGGNLDSSYMKGSLNRSIPDLTFLTTFLMTGRELIWTLTS